jgi:hypothetical protein
VVWLFLFAFIYVAFRGTRPADKAVAGVNPILAGLKCRCPTLWSGPVVLRISGDRAGPVAFAASISPELTAVTDLRCSSC